MISTIIRRENGLERPQVFSLSFPQECPHTSCSCEEGALMAGCFAFVYGLVPSLFTHDQTKTI